MLGELTYNYRKTFEIALKEEINAIKILQNYNKTFIY